MLAGEGGLVVVNSCAGTAQKGKTARQGIRRARRERPDARIVVTGCAAEIEPKTFRAMAEVFDVVPNTAQFDADRYRFSGESVERLPVSGLERGVGRETARAGAAVP